MTARRVAGALVALGITMAAGCTSAGEASDGTRSLTVLAAASLTEPFTTLAERFEAEHPGVEVVPSYDSSATIAAQVVAGAPADVVATADTRTMRSMQEAGVLAGPPVVFARNELALVVPPDNPAGIDDLADLRTADYVACVRSAPCGALATALLAETGVTNPPRSNEVDVKAVLMKVQMGEADAGLVYASDVVAAGDRVRAVPLPDGHRTATDYPVAVTADSEHPDLAHAWTDLVRSDEGQRVLADAGFATGAGTGAATGASP